jgi:hypothetical protein
MRTCGVICFGLGCVLLVMSLFPLFLAENYAQFFLGLGCAGFLALPLLIAGMIYTRRFAAEVGPDGEAKASAAFLQTATFVYQCVGGGEVQAPDPHGDWMDRIRSFDLNTVTFAGWLLVLATGGFLVGEEILLYRLLFHDEPPPSREEQRFQVEAPNKLANLDTRPNHQALPQAGQHKNPGPLGALVVVGGVLPAIGFFYGGRLLLKAFGVPMIQNVPSSASGAAGP